MDRAQGYKSAIKHYDRQTYIVYNTAKCEIKVQIYVAQPEYIDHNLLPHPDYFAQIISGGISCGLPDDYIKSIIVDNYIKQAKISLNQIPLNYIKVTDFLQKALKVFQEIPIQGDNLDIKLTGIFKDDPFYEEFIQNIADYREQLDIEMEAHDNYSNENKSV